MYATILWATDGSPEADGALCEALALMKPGGTLVALHCDEQFAGGRINGASVDVDEADRQEHIAAQVTDLRRDGVNVNYIVESTHHDPSREIPTIATELEVDAIVCGTTAPHGLNALLSGSVAAGILKRATVPVIVVPAKALVAHPDAAAVLTPRLREGRAETMARPGPAGVTRSSTMSPKRDGEDVRAHRLQRTRPVAQAPD